MKTQRKLILLGAMLILAMGCGEDMMSKDKEQGTQVAQPAVPNQNQLMTQFGSLGYSSPFGPRLVGMYDGVGTEEVRPAPGQVTTSFPSAKHWFARIEFVKSDGTAVDPGSFSMPLGIWRVKISLVCDANPTIKYVTDGEVYVMSDPAYAIMNRLGVPLRSYDANGTVLYELKFGTGMGTGPMLGLFRYDGRIFGGSITLIDASGKHIIQY